MAPEWRRKSMEGGGGVCFELLHQLLDGGEIAGEGAEVEGVGIFDFHDLNPSLGGMGNRVKKLTSLARSGHGFAVDEGHAAVGEIALALGGGLQCLGAVGLGRPGVGGSPVGAGWTGRIG